MWRVTAARKKITISSSCDNIYILNLSPSQRVFEISLEIHSLEDWPVIILFHTASKRLIGLEAIGLLPDVSYKTNLRVLTSRKSAHLFYTNADFSIGLLFVLQWIDSQWEVIRFFICNLRPAESIIVIFRPVLQIMEETLISKLWIASSVKQLEFIHLCLEISSMAIVFQKLLINCYGWPHRKNRQPIIDYFWEYSWQVLYY